jgi:hypothetical protein
MELCRVNSGDVGPRLEAFGREWDDWEGKAQATACQYLGEDVLALGWRIAPAGTGPWSPRVSSSDRYLT